MSLHFELSIVITREWPWSPPNIQTTNQDIYRPTDVFLIIYQFTNWHNFLINYSIDEAKCLQEWSRDVLLGAKIVMQEGNYATLHWIQKTLKPLLNKFIGCSLLPQSTIKHRPTILWRRQGFLTEVSSLSSCIIRRIVWYLITSTSTETFSCHTYALLFDIQKCIADIQ